MRNTTSVSFSNKSLTTILGEVDGDYVYYPLHDGTATVTTNTAGWPAATIEGATPANMWTNAGWATGNGTDLAARVADAAVVRGLFTTNDLGSGYIVFSVWLTGDFDSVAATESYVTFGNVNGVDVGISLTITSGKKVLINCVTDTGDDDVRHARVLATADGYVHVMGAVTTSGGDTVLSLFLDGVEEAVGTTTVTGTFSTASEEVDLGFALLAGMTGAGSSNDFSTLQISDVLICRTPNDVTASLDSLAVALSAARELPQEVGTLL